MPAAKFVKLSEDTLALYYQMGREISVLKKKQEDLRRQILAALHANRKPDPKAPFICELSSYDKESIPWEEEAKRWKKIAMEFGAALGKKPAALKKLEIVYPKVPVERLTISPKKAQEEEAAE